MDSTIVFGVVVAALLLGFAVLVGRLRAKRRFVASPKSRDGGSDVYLAAGVVADPGSTFAADCGNSPSSCDGGDGGGGGGD